MKLKMNKTLLRGLSVVGLVLGMILPGPVQAKWLTLHNDFFMYDLDGNKINTRSGTMRKFGDTFYWYGSGNRFTDQTCYSSKDLLHWTYRGVALKAASTNRMDVAYNESTKKYVMFLKTGASDGAELGIATSTTPEGPYTLIGNSKVFGYNIGDMSVYQDDDGQAYLAYVWDSIPGANSGGVSQHALARFSPDYLTLSKRMMLWNRGNREGNLVLKRNGLYYYMTSLTLWTESTASQYYTARNIEGPWTNNLVPMLVPGNTANNSWDSQCDFVLPIKGPKDTVQMYVGDRWEKPDPARLGDYVFLPLTFTAKDSIVANYYQDWEMDPDMGVWRAIEDARNLASGKTATASSSGTGTAPGNVTLATTTWKNYLNSKWTSGATDNEWIQVDLGSAKDVNRVILKWDSSYAKAFKIQTSVDAAAWTDVFSTTTGAARSVTDETFATTQARYVRMQGVTRGTTKGYTLYQFMVLKDSLPAGTAARPAKASAKPALLTYGNNMVRYSVPADQNVKLELWDTRGHLVATLDAGYKSAGSHQMTLPLGSLVSGAYVLKLSLGAQRAAQLGITVVGP